MSEQNKWNKNRIEIGDVGIFKSDDKDAVEVKFVEDKKKPRIEAEGFVNMKACGVAQLHQLIGRDYSQLAVLTAVIAYFSKDTFVCDCTIAKIAEEFDMNRHVVSRAFEALQNKQIMLWGKSEKNEGFVFNPDFFVAGKEYKYKKMWEKAVVEDESRQRKFAEREANKILKRIQKRIDAGEVENFVLDDELAKIKDASIRSSVEFELTPALEEDF